MFRRISQAHEALEDDDPDEEDIIIVGHEEDAAIHEADEDDMLEEEEAAIPSVEGRTSPGAEGFDVVARRVRSAATSFKNPFKHPAAHYCAAFREHFAADDPVGGLRDLCLTGKFKCPPLRHICWSIFLDLLPPKPTEWTGLIRSRREKYDLMKEAHEKDERDSDRLSTDINNPLSQDEKSPWTKYFADSELKKEIVRVRSISF